MYRFSGVSPLKEGPRPLCVPLCVYGYLWVFLFVLVGNERFIRWEHRNRYEIGVGIGIQVTSFSV